MKNGESKFFSKEYCKVSATAYALHVASACLWPVRRTNVISDSWGKPPWLHFNQVKRIERIRRRMKLKGEELRQRVMDQRGTCEVIVCFSCESNGALHCLSEY